MEISEYKALQSIVQNSATICKFLPTLKSLKGDNKEAHEGDMCNKKSNDGTS